MVAAHDWELWSTHARLVVTEPGALDEAVVRTRRLLAEVEEAASRFRDDAEIRRLTPGPDGTVLVSPVLADLLGEALAAARSTDGAVDPTVGTSVSALGYDRDIRLVESPGAVVALVRPAPGWGRLRLVGRRLTIPADVEPDLGATAKAVAADRAAALVAERLGTGVLLSLGGDIATAGTSPTGGWQVLVQDAPDDPAAPAALPAGTALATSSTVRRTWRRGGETLHHIVDPATGRSAEPVWRTVSVAAPTCVAANTAATAAVVKGLGGLDWLRRRGLPARLVGRDGRVRLVGGWPEEAPEAA